MKYFWIIFSIFIMYLSISPCCDSGDCKNVSESHQTFNSQNENHEQHHQDACSPFCICSCCGNHLVNINFVSRQAIHIVFVELKERKITPYTFQFTSDFEANIWQPPKFC